MKFAQITLIFSIFALSASALVPLKPVIVSFPDATPDKIISEAMSMVKAAGGIITHEYKLIKGFAARVNAKGITAIQTMDQTYNAVIEEDMVVSITTGSS